MLTLNDFFQVSAWT